MSVENCRAAGRSSLAPPTRYDCRRAGASGTEYVRVASLVRCYAARPRRCLARGVARCSQSGGMNSTCTPRNAPAILGAARRAGLRPLARRRVRLVTSSAPAQTYTLLHDTRIPQLDPPGSLAVARSLLRHE